MWQTERVRAPILLVTIGVGACAFFLGRWQGARAESDTPVETKPEAAAIEAPSPARPKLGLVCARAGTSVVDDEGCEELELKERWCASELAECRRQRQTVRNEWPSDETVEDPGAWSDVVEEAFAECEIPGELELIDCTEYPCTAALRPPTPPADPGEFERQMQAAMNAVRACPRLRQAFGVDGSSVDPKLVGQALDVYRLDAQCGDAREKFLVLAAVDPNGAAFELMHKQDTSDEEDRDLNRWMYRRADDLAALWPCSGP